MAFKHSMLVSCALGALMTAPAMAQGGAQPTQGTAPSGANNSADAGTSGRGEGVAQAPPAAGDDVGGLQEIVVTANKREENLQRVAASVTAVSQAQLTRQGVKDPNDITKVVPEVQIQAGQYSNVAIRGIKTGAYGPTTDSPNAVHVDGVYISRFNALQGLFFDVQRIEVLAGPQGTLYGRNSAGGTINIISNKPTMDDFHAQGSLEYGNYNQFTANAAINVPISPTLAVRGAYYHFSHRGYRNNGTDDAAQDSGRISLLWKPSSTDSLLITADREVQGGKGAAGPQITSVVKQPTIVRNLVPTPCGSQRGAPAYYCAVAAGTPGGTVVPFITGGSHDYLSTIGALEAQKLDIRSFGTMGQYDHDFGFANLTVQGSYRENIVNNTTGNASGYPQDGRLLTSAVITTNNFGGTGLGGNTGNSKWNSQEIRLTSPSNQELTWVAGLYRFHEKVTNGALYTYDTTYPPTAANPGPPPGTVQVTQPLIKSTNVVNGLLVDNSYAVFGQATYSPAFFEGLHLTGGVRYNSEKKHGTGFEVLNTVLNPASQFDLRRKDTAVTYKANVSYDITPRNLIYGDISTGFKSGGFAYGITPSYDPEKITSFEVGTKNRFFNGKVQLNASAWHYNYRNIVTTIFQFYLNPQGQLGNVINTVNGRRAKVDGQSVSLEVLPTRDDILVFNGTHTNARFTDYNIVAFQQTPINLGILPGATPATFTYDGTPIGNVPKFTYNASYDHIFHVFGGEVDAQVAAHYVGKTLYGNQQSRASFNTYIVGKGYTTGDLSLRYSPDGSKWSITTYVRNVTNKDVHLSEGYASSADYLAATDPRVTFAFRTTTFGPPRTYGAILSFNF